MSVATLLQKVVVREELPSLAECAGLMSLDPARPESIPFSCGDATAGSETELQAGVRGSRHTADLPLSIENSNYFANVIRRAAAGDTPRAVVTALEQYLESGSDGFWENSWVRFSKRCLNSDTQLVLARDLLADRSNPSLGWRSDKDSFVIEANGEEQIRVPISYLLKLSLTDILCGPPSLPQAVRMAGARVMPHFFNDNTSPETSSFHIASLQPECGNGRRLAAETAKRYLFTQLLVQYANEKFELRENGQEALLYFAPNPPIRQKLLNDCISDAFYRELFMSPCLSGWENGEAKRDYMVLCHQVLSRSHLNGVMKLREAGIVTWDLVVLPNTSNVGLANNGTHVTLGSRKLTGLLSDPGSGFTPAHEKYIGDLAIKIQEHFLPLSVGAYSGAPYRIDFVDFHPERLLGFLAHELDYTHLRMTWRRWKKKARNQVFGHARTPFGPHFLDRLLSAVFRLRGDLVTDYRLIDYLVALMSTEKSPALDGRLGNGHRLAKDLDNLGVFDARMTLYLFCRMREFAAMGFSGFEGRHYSMFESLETDLTHAANLQMLVTALAFQYMARGEITHGHIPDEPFVESERRQIVFGSAVGLPTFYVRGDTPNLLLRKILQRTAQTRSSARYPGYVRVLQHEYQRALLDVLQWDGAELIDAMHLHSTIRDLRRRLDEPEQYSAVGKLTKGILDSAGARSAFQLNANEFNRAAERWYREPLRRRQMDEGFLFLLEDLKHIDRHARNMPEVREALRSILGSRDARRFLDGVRRDVLAESAPLDELKRLVFLMLIVDQVCSEEPT